MAVGVVRARRRSVGRRALLLVYALVAVSVGGGVATRADAAGALTASPPAVDFGNRRVGMSEHVLTESIEDHKTTVTLLNSGDAPITVGSISAEGGNAGSFWGFTGLEPGTYRFNPAFDCLKAADGINPRTLAPGSSCVMFVVADASSMGRKSTTMTVRDQSGMVLLGVPLTVDVTQGYYVARGGGSVTGLGDAVHLGDRTGAAGRPRVVGVEQAPFRNGYWLAAADGGVFTYGDRTPFLGSAGGLPLNAPVVGMSANAQLTPLDDLGYYLVARDGGVFNYGWNSSFRGSMAGKPLNGPVVDIAGGHDGYTLAAEDGGVFAFGQAQFFGAMAGRRLNAPIVAVVSTRSGEGYWLVGADGGVFAFGNARFAGSLAGIPLVSPIVDMTRSPTGGGYWLLAADGSVFAFGDAPYLGNASGSSDAAAIAATALFGLEEELPNGGFRSVNDPPLPPGDTAPVVRPDRRAP